MYYGTGNEPQVVLTVWTLLAALFGLGLALGVVIAVGLLLVFQVKSIMRNQTGIEDWIMEKATYRHRNSGKQVVSGRVMMMISYLQIPSLSGHITWVGWPTCSRW